MWRLRDAGAFPAQWKVTARFDVWLKPNVVMKCVRVSYFGRPGSIVRHYSVAEFLRLFVLVGPPHLLPSPDVVRSA
jgi:hypothetical protein